MINKLIDHTLLKQDATSAQIEILCTEAREHDFMSVCVNPSYVELSAKLLSGSDVKVCTVVGFPLGMTTTASKVFEANQALNHGATEIDMVINVGALKEKRDAYVRDEIAAIKEVCGDNILKVILETCLLNEEEIIRACRLAVEAGADFVKTSTGFSTGGATVEDVRLMKETVGERAEVKASGGVRSITDLQAMVEAGATRIGTSGGVALIKKNTNTSDY